MNLQESNKILTDLNHGFRGGYSCDSQLIVTLDDLLRTNDRSAQVNCVILDFSKAFNTVSHKSNVKPQSNKKNSITQETTAQIDHIRH